MQPRRYALVGHFHSAEDIVDFDEASQDAVGSVLVDSSSIDFTYDDATPSITASVIPEFVQDTVGAMLSDSASIDFTYTDGGVGAGTFTGVVLPAGVDHGGLAGLADDDHPQYPLAASTETISGAWTFTSSIVGDITGNVSAIFNTSLAGGSYATFRRGGVDKALFGNAAQILFSPAATDDLAFYSVNGGYNFGLADGNVSVRITGGGELQIVRDNDELQIGAGQDLRLYHDGTNSIIENETGVLRIIEGSTTVADFTTARLDVNLPIQLKGYTVAGLPTGAQGDTAYVTDALAPAFLTAVVGGGAVITPVFYDGTNWVSY